MPDIILKERRQEGSVTVIALMILVVLTLIGISATRTSMMDIQIAANVIPFKQDFYLAQGGLHREAAELGRGKYPVTNVTASIPSFPFPPDPADYTPLAHDGSGSLPGDAHQLPDIDGDGSPEPYFFNIHYMGFYAPPTGYSVIHFSRYDYTVATTGGNVRSASRYYKVGPRAE